MLQPKEIVDQFFSNVSNGRIEDAFKLVSDDVIWWVPEELPFSGLKDKRAYMNIVQNIQRGFPDGFKLTVKSMIAEGDTVAAEVESDGLHTNGKRYQNKYHFLIKIKNGVFIHVKEYMNTLHLARLLG